MMVSQLLRHRRSPFRQRSENLSFTQHKVLVAAFIVISCVVLAALSQDVREATAQVMADENLTVGNLTIGDLKVWNMTNPASSSISKSTS
jgi:hypothetical protein